MAIWAVLKTLYPYLTEKEIAEMILHLDGLYASGELKEEPDKADQDQEEKEKATTEKI